MGHCMGAIGDVPTLVPPPPPILTLLTALPVEQATGITRVAGQDGGVSHSLLDGQAVIYSGDKEVKPIVDRAPDHHLADGHPPRRRLGVARPAHGGWRSSSLMSLQLVRGHDVDSVSLVTDP
jgi:hypothetical protein